jgi:hypothetical protein
MYVSSIQQLAFVRDSGCVFCEVKAFFFGIILIIVPKNVTIYNFNNFDIL